MLCNLQPCHQARVSLGKSNKKENTSPGGQPLAYPPHSHTPTLQASAALSSVVTAPKELSSSWLPAYAPPVPPPGMPFPSFLPGEQLPVAPGPGSEAPHPQGLLGTGRRPPWPFTHCTLPPPEAEGPVPSHQQICQGPSNCQVPARDTPSFIFKTASLSLTLASTKGSAQRTLPPLCSPLLRPPLAASILATPAPHSLPSTQSFVLPQGLCTCSYCCLECSLNTPPPMTLHHFLSFIFFKAFSII